MKWEKVKINDICNLVRGSSPRPQGDLSLYGGPVPRLMIEDITRDGMYVTATTDSLTELGSTMSRAMKKGDLVLTVSGRTGVPAILSADACIHDGFVGFRDLSSDANVEYLYYYLSFLTEKTNARSVGAIFKNLTTDQVKNIEVPLPPLYIQEQIADTLDKADALCRKDQELLKKYDELSQAIFYDMFGEIILNKKNYPLYKFGEVCDELFLGLTSKVDYVESGGFPLVRTTDINTGTLSLSNVKFISEEQHKKITARRITKRGDILMSKSGTLGICAIVDTDVEFTTYESIFTIRPKKSLLGNIFLLSLLRNSSFQEKLLGGKVGAGVTHLNLNMLRDLVFPLPPIELQKRFAHLINNSNNQLEIARSMTGNNKKLFYTVMDQYFK